MIGRRQVPPPPSNPFLTRAPDADGSGTALAGRYDAGRDDGGGAGGEPVCVDGPAAPTGAPAPAEPLLVIPPSLLLRTPHSGAGYGAGARRGGIPARATDVWPGGGLGTPTAPTAFTAPTELLLLQVCGLHGGAGATTVAGLLGDGVVDCGTGLTRLVAATVPVLFVARTHAAGLSLLRRAAAQWASGGLDQLSVLGVVLLDDAPTSTDSLAREVQSSQRMLPHCWRIRWSEPARHAPTAADVSAAVAASGRGRRLRRSLLQQAHELRARTAAANTGTGTGGGGGPAIYPTEQPDQHQVFDDYRTPRPHQMEGTA